MSLFSFDDEYEQNNDQKRRIFSILMAFQMFSIWEDKEFHIGCWAILTPEGDTSKTFMSKAMHFLEGTTNNFFVKL